jgi:hypothetical protein
MNISQTHLFKQKNKKLLLGGLFLSGFAHYLVWVIFGTLDAPISKFHETTLSNPVMDIFFIRTPSQRLPDHTLQFETPPPLRMVPLKPDKLKRKARVEISKLGTAPVYAPAQEVDTIERISETLHDSANEARPRLEIEHLKALARQDESQQANIYLNENARQRRAAELTNDSGKNAIERARRPKCDQDYVPQVGSVKFTGLMKLPFLVKGAISDEGCKW